MTSLMRSATCSRPAIRPELRSPQQTLFHLVPSSSTVSNALSIQLKTQRINGRGRSVSLREARGGSCVARATEQAGKTDTGAAGDESSKQFAISIARVADEVKCSDIVVLDVAPVVSWTSFLVVATVFSKPQLLAALARVEKAAAEQFGRARLNLPGSSPWETLDFGDVVLHLFTAEQRDYYDIESFYAAAEEVEVSFGPPGGGPPGQSGGAAEQQRPTWSTRL
ncbi:hypothetical protein GPECTOR_7g912 [Gonium pectorale]|uniref:Uncharacterized protein n=1 Tax=Gonium pectorale TaxID=33097 RepID=A0A150GUT1_GONPE|nr:hypothetical protein GPECTOR_7g912 [Gonium pectorale]|eukprot:KXZ53462.1 hypothetical protein GPECTOR_7g912 [Gonium pectorale]